jgi:hypothetical protein
MVCMYFIGLVFGQQTTTPQEFKAAIETPRIETRQQLTITPVILTTRTLTTTNIPLTTLAIATTMLPILTKITSSMEIPAQLVTPSVVTSPPVIFLNTTSSQATQIPKFQF